MSKRMIRLVSIMVGVVMMIVGLVGCGEKNEVQELIERFESACRTADVEGILDCCDPKFANPVRKVFKVFGAEPEDLTDLLYGIFGLGMIAEADLGENDVETLLDSLDSINISPIEYDFNEEKTQCKVKVMYSGVFDNDEIREEGEIVCFVRDEQWYIAVNL